MPWLILLGIACTAIYLPTIYANFDFKDDGATANPVGVATLAELNQLVWRTTCDEFRERGPFRPVIWYCWRGQQELFQGNICCWRWCNFFYTALCATALLWFLQEFGFGPWVAFLTTVLAMWNPFRGEVWLSLTYGEGYAMPFALLALVSAYRATRSPRAWMWDVTAVTSVLLTIGVKNVFAVVVPAQMFLRVCAPGLTLCHGIRRHGWRALLLSVSSIFPIIHFICYRHLTRMDTPDRYDLAWEWQQPLRMLWGLLAAANKDFTGPAVIAALVAWWWASRAGGAESVVTSKPGEYRAAIGTGLILLVLGWAVYWPVPGVSGRYTMPGVWGLDLFSALIWTKLSHLPWRQWTSSPLQKLSWAALGCGLVATAISNLGKQEKNLVRVNTLWEVLYVIEDRAPEGSCIRWAGVPCKGNSEDLEQGEGVHFRWHVQGRGRQDLRWQIDGLTDPNSTSAEPDMLITTSPTPPDSSTWTLVQKCKRSYRLGQRTVVCYVWQRGTPHVFACAEPER